MLTFRCFDSSNLDPFALIILLPVLDLLVYPALRKAGIRFSPLRRVFAGFVFGSLAMVRPFPLFDGAAFEISGGLVRDD